MIQTTIPAMPTFEEQETAVVRRRGRPKGSKNKKNTVNFLKKYQIFKNISYWPCGRFDYNGRFEILRILKCLNFCFKTIKTKNHVFDEIYLISIKINLKDRTFSCIFKITKKIYH
ncbi:hypothetical protein BpHYR1_018906 [Brachionus plicatilis]|uniref:Uncharacterized protein n=1 Tax=Brachionus plicatilis TaxID=10195 RepID=A0A3M7P1H7_BRAPC|nr:hypothetical protein BpHYR1_018906 [Brachionus plicatilis]